MSHLRLVPPTKPSSIEEARERIKAMPRPDGALQCSRCGGRTTLTFRTGTVIKEGRIKPGTLTDQYICAICYRVEGLKISLLPPVIKPA